MKLYYFYKVQILILQLLISKLFADKFFIISTKKGIYKEKFVISKDKIQRKSNKYKSFKANKDIDIYEIKLQKDKVENINMN